MSATLELVKDPVTTNAAAEMLGISRSAVLKAIKKTRKLTAEAFGRDYAIEREEVERYRRERKMTGPRRNRRPPSPAPGGLGAGESSGDDGV